MLHVFFTLCSVFEVSWYLRGFLVSSRLLGIFEASWYLRGFFAVCVSCICVAHGSDEPSREFWQEKRGSEVGYMSLLPAACRLPPTCYLAG
jgi:hypothetical protein